MDRMKVYILQVIDGQNETQGIKWVYWTVRYVGVRQNDCLRTLRKTNQMFN